MAQSPSSLLQIIPQVLPIFRVAIGIYLPAQHAVGTSLLLGKS